MNYFFHNIGYENLLFGTMGEHTLTSAAYMGMHAGGHFIKITEQSLMTCKCTRNGLGHFQKELPLCLGCALVICNLVLLLPVGLSVRWGMQGANFFSRSHRNYVLCEIECECTPDFNFFSNHADKEDTQDVADGLLCRQHEPMTTWGTICGWRS